MALFEDEDKVEYLHMCEHYLFKMSVLDFRQSILDLVLTISRKEATRVWRCISRTKMNVIFLSQTLSFQCMNHEFTLYDGALNCFNSKVLHNVQCQTHWEWPSLIYLRNSSFNHLSINMLQHLCVCICLFGGGGVCHIRGFLWPNSKSYRIVD
jgi:hypothetical protein